MFISHVEYFSPSLFDNCDKLGRNGLWYPSGWVRASPSAPRHNRKPLLIILFSLFIIINFYYTKQLKLLITCMDNDTLCYRDKIISINILFVVYAKCRFFFHYVIFYRFLPCVCECVFSGSSCFLSFSSFAQCVVLVYIFPQHFMVLFLSLCVLVSFFRILRVLLVDLKVCSF